MCMYSCDLSKLFLIIIKTYKKKMYGKHNFDYVFRQENSFINTWHSIILIK